MTAENVRKDKEVITPAGKRYSYTQAFRKNRKQDERNSQKPGNQKRKQKEQVICTPPNTTHITLSKLVSYYKVHSHKGRTLKAKSIYFM